ncbi:MAG TPA: hypothetical protein VFN69_04525 [Rudaea sp.]|nr:hypothetical protein [Rudaea sp.]
MNAPKFTPDRQSIEDQYEAQSRPLLTRYQAGELSHSEYCAASRILVAAYWSARAALAKAVQ